MAVPDHEIAGSFFVTGGTVPEEAASYVERAADKALFDSLLAGKFCYVLNSRQMGKSSLCVRTMKRLEASGVRTAFVDLTKIGGRNVTPEQWYAGIAVEIGRSLGLRGQILGHWKENSHLSPMQRLFGAVREVVLEDEPLRSHALFFDEIDATRTLPFSADEFFAGIRECYNRRVQDPVYDRLAFCLLGVAVPSDLINSPTSTPFNIGERIYLRDFTLEEAGVLAEGLGPNGRALLQRVFYWTNGHPYLTQSLCSALSTLHTAHSTEHTVVDALVRRDLFQPKARETNINLADVANRALHAGDLEPDPEKFRADLLSAYEKAWKGKPVADDESNRVAALLKLSGIMRVEAGQLKVRNRIYETVFDRVWVRENMPGQELRRQRRAFWLGVARTTVIAVVVIGVIGYLALSNASLRRNAEAAREKALYDAYVSDLTAMRTAYREGDLYRLQALLDETRDRPYRNVEWNFWNAKLNDAQARSPYPRGVGTMAVAGDGKSVVVEDLESPTDTVLSIPGLSVIRQFPVVDRASQVWELGSRPVHLKEVDPSQVAILDASSGRLVGRAHVNGFINGQQATANGRFLSANWRNRDERYYNHVTAWRTDTFREIWSVFVKGSVINYAISEDASKLVVGTYGRPSEAKDFEVCTIDTHNGRILDSVAVASHSASGSDVLAGTTAIHTSFDGEIVAMGDTAGRILVRDGKLHRNLFYVKDPSGTLSGISGDGRRLTTAEKDLTVKVWDVRTGTVLKTVKSGSGGEMLRDGRYLLAEGPGMRLYGIDAYAGAERSRRFDGSIVRPALRTGAASKIVVPSGKNWAFLNPDSLAVERLLPAGEFAQASADGNYTLQRDGARSAFRSVSSGQVVCRIPLRSPYYCFDAAADGESFVTIDTTYRILYRFDARGRTLWRVTLPETAWCTSISPDRRRVAVSLMSGDIELFDFDSGRMGRSLKGGFGFFPAPLAFSPDSRYLAIGFGDMSVVVFDVAGTEPPVACRGHRAMVWSVAFAPDGKRLISAAQDGTAQVWDWRTGRELLRIVSPDGPLSTAGFGYGGSSIHTVSNSGMVRTFPAPWPHSVP